MERPLGDCGRPSSRVIGVTGGIASGKSTVVAELARLGAVTLSADEIARRIVEPDGPAYAAVVDAFGPEVLREDGRLDRAALAERIYADPAERRRLESLLHPIIMKEIDARIEVFRSFPPNDPPVMAVEIPLLFEVGAEGRVDGVLTVAVEQEVQFSRLKQRTHWPDTRVRNAILSQLPLPEKIRRSRWVVRTDGDVADTLKQTRALWHHITQSLKEDPPCP